MTQFLAVATGLAVAASSAAADVVASCIAPQGSVCTACPTTSYHDYGNGNGGCSDGTDVPDCYPTVEACCADYHMTQFYPSTQECIDTSNAYVAPTVAPTPTSNPVECENAVSLSEANTNQYCMDACVAANGAYQNLPQWTSGECSIQGYQIVDNIVDISTSQCFSGWIYGYSEPAVLATYKHKWVNTDTPAQCQLLCQQDDQCVNWAWGSEMVDDSAQHKVCTLKNSNQVQGALNVDTSVSYWPKVGPTMNVRWCNYEMEESCATAHYKCLSCSGDLRCVWWSDLHVAGWKYCTPHDSCSVDPSGPTVGPFTGLSTPAAGPTTPAAAPTTPVVAPTTPAPTTPAPTTPAPTTPAPTTPAPTTPTTPAPTTPTTPAPTTPTTPTTPAPTTPAPTTPAPTTPAPTTPAPTTPAPTTPAPTTQAPTTQAPTTPAPTTQAPTTPAPTTPAPTTPVPLTTVATSPALSTDSCVCVCP